MQKNHFLVLKKLKNTESDQLWTRCWRDRLNRSVWMLYPFLLCTLYSPKNGDASNRVKLQIFPQSDRGKRSMMHKSTISPSQLLAKKTLWLLRKVRLPQPPPNPGDCHL